MIGIAGTVSYLTLRRSRALAAVHYSRQLMGTVVNLTVCGPSESACREAIERCLARMEVLSTQMSTYNQDSPLSRLNRDGILRQAPPELLEVLALSRELSELTDGAFDPTVLPLMALYKGVKQSGLLPERQVLEQVLKKVDYRQILIESDNTVRLGRPGMGVTLDAVAKGYIVDQGVEQLQLHKINHAYVEAGGDLMVIGRRQDGQPWRIGIRNPRSDDLRRMDVISLTDRAIATSGDYLQYFTEDRRAHHIIDPHSGFSPIQLASSSILAPTVAKADGLATATMVLGTDRSLKLLESLPDCEGYFIDKDLNKFSTKGFFQPT